MQIQLIKVLGLQQKQCLEGNTYNWIHILEKKKYKINNLSFLLGEQEKNKSK